MPTRMNPMAGRYFNDPSFAAGISNLASAFAPPSADEALGWSQLKAQNAQNDALGQLMASANGNVDILGGVAAGGWTPNQGFENFRAGRANERYATDVGARTTLATNAADNERALREAALGIYSDPAGRQAGGDPVMDAILGFDVPEFSMAGPVAPTDAQVLGANRQEMLGGIPGLAEALAADGIDASNVVTPEGPRMMPTGLAAVEGMEPHLFAGAEAAPKPIILVDTETGQQVGGFATGGQYVLGDGVTPAPPNLVPQQLPQATGPADQLGATTANRTRLNNDLYEAEFGLQRVDEFERLLRANPGVLGVAGTVQGFTQSAIQGLTDIASLVGADTVIQNVDELNTLIAEAGRVNGWNENIAKARAMALEMAYYDIKSQDPGGEVNVRELERVLGVYMGGFAGNQPVLDTLSVTRSRLQLRAEMARRNLGADAEAPQPGAGAGTPPPAGGGAFIEYDAEGNRIR